MPVKGGLLHFVLISELLKRSFQSFLKIIPLILFTLFIRFEELASISTTFYSCLLTRHFLSCIPKCVFLLSPCSPSAPQHPQRHPPWPSEQSGQWQLAHPPLPHPALSIRAAKASASASSCSTVVLDNIAVPAGETLDLEDLQDGTKVIFSGETTFGYKEWDGPLVRISGSNIAVSGTSNHTINGGGERWWDGQGSNGGKTKPKFFYAHDLDDSTITGLNVKNTPIQSFSVGSDNIVLDSINIDNSDGDDNGGHNTDAFDVGESNGVTIRNAVVKNQDDCLAVNSGSNILFTGGRCFGGHGLSIGSVGGRDDNTVKNVTITHSVVSNSQNGIRIKAKSGETGSVSGVTFSNIQLSGVTDYGVHIEQDYDDEGNPTTGIPITDLTLKSVAGTVESDATPFYIMCGDGSCSDWTWSGVKVTGGKDSTCRNEPSGISC